ncbi:MULTISPECIES: hypothetical protein [unclassified Streptomyces]|uniref:hypothetical protein n=1 Tax=unclassified Streptomyces TaxID=2593676 RepID=UPI002E189C56|nr:MULTISPECIES: hypothetical protein [unclassified Streptomyces]
MIAGEEYGGRIALLGDAAHPPLQYTAQNAVMAVEDGWVPAHHVGARLAKRSVQGSVPASVQGAGVDWETALAAYEAVRTENGPRVVLTARARGELWHHTGVKREQRNAVMRASDPYAYSFMDWVYGRTTLTPDQEPPLCPTIPLDSVRV